MTASLRRVLITGANKGIGRAAVGAVLDHSEDTFVYLGSRSLERGEAARDALVAENSSREGRIAVIPIDVSSDASVKAAAAVISDKLAGDKLYGVVNNAGIGSGATTADIVQVNVYGPKRVTEAFLPMLDPSGRIVNVSSAAGPNFVAACREDRQAVLINPDVTWDKVESTINACVDAEQAGNLKSAGFSSESAFGVGYGLSKAALNAYTMIVAGEHPNLVVNACTPGFIETDMTRPFAESRGISPEEMGMKSPLAGTRAIVRLLLGEPGGTGWYFGSDAERSPIDRYRSPGDPPYTGD